jgi:hypothetical protein
MARREKSRSHRQDEAHRTVRHRTDGGSANKAGVKWQFGGRRPEQNGRLTLTRRDLQEKHPKRDLWWRARCLFLAR